jgi:hypothetical protein
MIHAYFGRTSEIVGIQKQVVDITSLIKEKSETSTSAIDLTRCINKAFVCSGANDAEHIN